MTLVLLVEDNPGVRSSLRELLELDGYEVAECPDVASSLDLIDRDARIDVAMVDYWLENETAEAVLAALRTKRPDVCVLLFTGGTDEITVETTRWLGASEGIHGFIQKPFLHKDIRELFRKFGF